jgi:long-subunit acyl-CoA synthetase (AMP-forming)
MSNTTNIPASGTAKLSRRVHPRARDAATVCQAFQTTVAQYGPCLALAAHGRQQTWTWQQYASAVQQFATGLAALGVARGDVVCFMLTNRPEFHIADAAAMHLGAIGCSIYNTSTVEQIRYVLDTAAPKVLVTEDAFCTQLLAAKSGAGSSAPIVVVDADSRADVMAMSDVETLDAPGLDFATAWQAVQPDDVLCLIYSSGTTGPPKAVELTHRNMMSELRAFDEVYPMTPAGRSISFLPHAHVGDRWANHYSAMVYGHGLHCLADTKYLFAYSAHVRPTLWGGVPRIWEKLKVAMEADFARQDDDTRKRVTAALAVGRERLAAKLIGEVPADIEDRWRQADTELFAPLRRALGLDEVEVFAVGAAPMPIHVLEFFAAMGIDIAEMWGLSECSSVGAINPPGAIMPGTVGKPLPGVEVRIADDGEILLRGPMVMRGYRNDPQRTADAIDPQGWLHSGDVGEFVGDGYLRLVDRKKELIINAAGKNMSPVNIESTIKAQSPLIEHAVAVGDQRPYNIALIVLAPEAADQHPDADRLITEAIERANAHLSRVEQIKHHWLITDPWEPGGPFLTPTAKLRRKPIAEHYSTVIDNLYR